ncbi:putative lysine-specific demethylase JMJ16 isoform X2 [Impatiens glandulifera]|uniref:putative lysine-specific demethylase JMJ16 isoform X2 n=1 Tax=Impatiens glandulifera TaxID=253017 RepID=UPI001FB0F947|nr:putative lysine-specific demethylase JMJ16 isoform X2 [Impatiens glandulifera]
MGMEIFRPCVQEENMDIPLIPPGFESFTTVVKPKSLQGKEKTIESVNVFESQSVQSSTELHLASTRTLRHRPSVNYNKFDGYLEDEVGLKQNFPYTTLLPKGVIRGCLDCTNCQKVTARWHPDEARRPDLDEVPVFYPSEEEFQDTLNYIASIRPRAEQYGICRIVPPPSWKPPCPLKEKNKWDESKFLTRIQRIDKLQNREPLKKTVKNSNKRRKRRRCVKMGVEGGSSADDGSCETELIDEAPIFGFESGPEFTIGTFQKYADDFKGQYFRKNNSDVDQPGGDHFKVKEQYGPSVSDIEGEYWRILEKPTEEIEVLYGADIDTEVFGSGFPKLSDKGDSNPYVTSGWNLNNFPRLPGSVLSYESSNISGVLVPWLYVGMCFSSFCWHVEDHHLYSLNYMHWGASKLWYGVPEQDAIKFERAMKKHLPQLFQEQPDLLHKLITQISPAILKSEGVSVYRCVQNAGEFVITFPRAYHSGFNCGFNCAEAVNVAPVDWLLHGKNAVELYREQGRKTSVSHDKLLLGAAREAVKAQWELNLLRKNTSENLRWKSFCGKNGILTKALKDRIEEEQVRRGFLCSSSRVMKMESDFDSTIERECSICLFDLHLSAAGCSCSPDKYACLSHAYQLCSCSQDMKNFLVRYDINELNILVEALGGKLSAIYRWARLDFGVSLTSHISSGDSQTPAPVDTKTNEKVGETIQNDKLSQRSSSSSSLLFKIKVGNTVSSIKEEKISHSSNQVSLEEVLNGDHSVKRKSKLQTPTFPVIGDIILLSDDDGDEPNDQHVEDSETLPGSMNVLIPSDCESQAQSQLPEPFCAEVSSSVTNGGNCIGNELLRYEDSGSSVIGSNSNSRMMIDIKPTAANLNQQIIQSNIDRCSRPKGLRIAKVMRRINCNVEIMEYGIVQSGMLWSDSRAIFPKGYRSRVKYTSVLDPTNTCYYVSEILDNGRGSPLFMVSLEENPNEVFVHVSATKCWEMVRDRANQEILKQHKLGRNNLPPLQPRSLDGIEMFGFTSPTIMQVMQAKDKNRVSTEYWRSRPLLQIPQDMQHEANDSKKTNVEDEAMPIASHAVLNGLLKKADFKELQVLNDVVSDSRPTVDREVLTKIIHEEIERRLR